MRLIRRLRYWMRQRREAGELAEEMELHRALAEDAQRAEGLSEERARAAAKRLMGNATLASEEARRVWLAAWTESVWQDLRYAARSLRNQPGFTALAMLALVLGIGLNTSLFTVINAFALRPSPVRDAERVVNLSAFTAEDRQYDGVSLAEYVYLSEHTQTLAGIVLESAISFAIDNQTAGPLPLVHVVSGNYFDVLGVPMALGRGFSPEEDREEAPETVAVLSHSFWREHYGGDPAIAGRRIRLDDTVFTIIGVAGAGFNGTSSQRRDLWIPTASLRIARPNVAAMRYQPTRCCSNIAGRLAPGVTREQAHAELSTLAAQFLAGYNWRKHEIAVFGTEPMGRPDERRRALPAVGLLAAAVLSVLLLACANVSNLLLARAAARQREIAVRVAIGAGRGRVIRQLLTESLLLAIISTGPGTLLAYLLPGFILRQVSDNVDRVNLAPDPAVLGCAVGLAALTAALFGLLPALRGTQIAVSEAMKRHSAQSGRRFALRGALLGIQVAISVALLAGAGLLIRGLLTARSLNIGLNVNGVTLIRVDRVPGGPAMRVFWDRVVEETGAPAGIAGCEPLADCWLGEYQFQLPEENLEDHAARIQYVSAGYFDVLDIPVVAGRNFIPSDTQPTNQTPPTKILVNESMARKFWPGQNPVGREIISGSWRREIVGVVRDAQIHGLIPVAPTMFQPFGGGSGTTLLVPEASAAAANTIIRRVEPRAIVTAAPLSTQLDVWLRTTHVNALLASALGIVALLLATVGVYGVISYAVEQRRREIGLRMALGARPAEVVWLILKQNGGGVLAGLAAGLAIAGAGSSALESSLYGVSRLDPLAYGLVLLLLLVASVVASFVPARRAARTDAISALHYE